MILSSLEVGPAEFAEATGWEIKPEGACKGPMCVPLPGSADGDGGDGGVDVTVDVAVAAGQLGMALVHDEDAGVWALGPESLGRHALMSAEAPELVLDDVDGTPFALSSLRGQKVVLVAWAPY